MDNWNRGRFRQRHPNWNPGRIRRFMEGRPLPHGNSPTWQSLAQQWLNNPPVGQPGAGGSPYAPMQTNVGFTPQFGPGQQGATAQQFNRQVSPTQQAPGQGWQGNNAATHNRGQGGYGGGMGGRKNPGMGQNNRRNVR